jgi:hypothetical protein
MLTLEKLNGESGKGAVSATIVRWAIRRTEQVIRSRFLPERGGDAG